MPTAIICNMDMLYGTYGCRAVDTMMMLVIPIVVCYVGDVLPRFASSLLDIPLRVSVEIGSPNYIYGLYLTRSIP